MLYRMVQLDPSPAVKVSSPFCRDMRIATGLLPGHQGVAWGIDPGVNFGLTVITDEKLAIYHGTLTQEREPGKYALGAYSLMRHMVCAYSQLGVSLVIEGAAYAKAFGQVVLSETRNGFYLAASLTPNFQSVHIIPPRTIRKDVFGNGNTQASEIWTSLNHNAADSLAIALFATGG